MPTTPILGINQVSASQNQKEVTINDAILALEAATNATLSVSLAPANSYSLSAMQASRNMIFHGIEATEPCQLRFPNEVNGIPFNRTFVVRNTSTQPLTVQFASGTGDTVVVPNGQARLVAAVNGQDMIVAAEPEVPVSFMSLNDSPGTYAGNAGRVLAVNLEENAIEFVDVSVFPSYTGNANKYLVLNGTATAVEWRTLSMTFAQLTDTPTGFAGMSGKLVAVNPSETGVEFIDIPPIEAMSSVSSTRWRIRTVEAGAELQVGWGEIEMLDVDGFNRVASGVVTASSFDTGREAAYAFDGLTSEGNGWLSVEGDLIGSWIEYEFPTAQSIRNVRLYPINGFPEFSPAQFIIEAASGIEWVDLGQREPAAWESGISQTFSVNGIALETIEEAPSGGGTYARRNGEWEEISEVVRDTIGAALRAGSNVSISVNDTADTITISATNTTDPEVVRDTMAAALVAGANTQLVVDDNANTITINSRHDRGRAGRRDQYRDHGQRFQRHDHDPLDRHVGRRVHP